MDAASVIGQNIDASTGATDDGSGVDAAKLLAGFNASANHISTSMSDLSDTLNAAAGATARKNVGTNEQMEGQSTINAIDSAIKQKTEARTAREAGAVGTDPDASSYVVTAMGSKILADEKAYQEQKDMVVSKMGQSFMDDPLQWVTNQFSLPFDQARMDVMATGVSHESATLSALLRTTTEMGQKNAAIEQTASEARLAATNKVLAGKAISAVAQSDYEMATLGLQGVSIKSNLDERQFTNLLQLNTAKNDAIRISLAQSANDISERSLANNIKYRTDQERMIDLNVANRQDQLEAIANTQKGLDRVTAIFGMRHIDAREFASSEFSPKLKATLQAAMADPNIEDGKLGFNAVESLNNANQLNLPLTPGQNVLRKKLLDIQNTTMKQNEMMWKSMTPEQRMQTSQNAIDKDLLKEATNIKPEGGVYSPPSLKTVIATPAILSGAPILTKALGPTAVADNQHPLNGSEVFKSALEQVVTGQASVEQMGKEISTIYRGANAINAETMQYNRFALPSLVEHHNTTVYTGTGWSGSRVIDMGNSVAVQGELLRAITTLQRQLNTGAAITPPVSPGAAGKPQVQAPSPSAPIKLRPSSASGTE